MSYKVSVIIPVYNAAEFIVEKTLKSIENQTLGFENIEVILVNDSSTDDTEIVLNEYANLHNNVRPIHLRENNGAPAEPRNIGISYASADYVMFLDQDDVYRPNACEVLYNKISSENVDIVCGNHAFVSKETSTIAYSFDFMESDEVKIDNIYDNPNFLDIGIVVWSKIFKKDFLIKNNIKFQGDILEELYFITRSFLLAKGIILLKNLIVVEYTIRDESLSHQIDYNYLNETIDIYLDYYKYIKDNLDMNCFQILFKGRMRQLLSVLFYPNIFFDELSLIFVKLQKLFVNLESNNFYFDDFLNQIFFKTIINDNFPFEDSILLYGLIKSKNHKNAHFENLYLTQVAKLYVDLGEGFNEKNVISQEFKISDDIVLKFDLSNIKNIKRLRFDPNFGFFIKCKIDKIVSNKGKLNFKPINSFNSDFLADIFLTIDPQYIIESNFDEIEFIKIKFKLELLNFGMTENIIKEL